MSEEHAWKNACLVELNQAARARTVGNEGMSRVCARRAAGVVIREYYRRRQEQPPVNSAYKLLEKFSTDQDLPENVQVAARKFTLVITHDHVLPEDVDLIEQVDNLAIALLEEGIEPEV
jgi:hypothetical protein